jgi:hypothetical protein
LEWKTLCGKWVATGAFRGHDIQLEFSGTPGRGQCRFTSGWKDPQGILPSVLVWDAALDASKRPARLTFTARNGWKMRCVCELKGNTFQLGLPGLGSRAWNTPRPADLAAASAVWTFKRAKVPGSKK